MYRPVQERVILPNLHNPILLSAFATPGKGGSTAASALSYLAQQWGAEPVAEFVAEGCYDHTRIRPQLQTVDGQTSLQWPSNRVYLAQPQGLDRSVLLLVGVEPSTNWQSFIEVLESFCRRTGVESAITLHCTPASVSHRWSTPVTAVYGSQEMQASLGLPPTVFHEGPMSFSAVLTLHLNALGCQTADLIALEPFYTPGLPDAQAALALIQAIDRYLGCQTPVESLIETANSQREAYEQAVAQSGALSQIAERLEQAKDGTVMLESRSSELSVEEVMDEVEEIFNKNK